MNKFEIILNLIRSRSLFFDTFRDQNEQAYNTQKRPTRTEKLE